jgi:hypothetical protein
MQDVSEVPDFRRITDYLEQIPSSEANSCSGSQEIPRPLRNTTVNYRVKESP